MSAQILSRSLAIFIATLLVSSCVTETSGGMPGPAPKATRVAAQLDLARGYLAENDWGRARLPLERALEIDPQNVETHVLRAVLYQAENEPVLAEQHYLTALKIQPANPQALNNYGSFLYSQGRFKDAVKPLNRLVKDANYRARPQAFENLGLAYLRTGDKEAASASFERAVELNFRLPRANLELAEIAYNNGVYAQALERFRIYNGLARPSARSLCLGLKLAVATENSDQVASYGLALKNLFPDQASQCQTNG